ncbi:MAG: hypothetical protein ACP5VR_03675 [Acidimicrobiales bacterium]
MSNYGAHGDGWQKPRYHLVALSAAAAISLLVVACTGSAASASTTKHRAKKPAATKPVTKARSGATGAAGSGAPSFAPAAFGTIASISGDMLEVQDQQTATQTTVDLTSKTTITETVASGLKSVTAGVCVSAVGTKGPAGTVAATSVTIFSSTNGSCSFVGAFRGGGSARPGGFTLGPASYRPRTTVTRPANFASATGKVVSVAGRTITLRPARVLSSGRSTSASAGTAKISVGPSTKYSKFEHVSAKSLKVGECATAIGTTNDIGVVTARSLSVSQPTSAGCTGGFGGLRGGFFPGGASGGGAA